MKLISKDILKYTIFKAHKSSFSCKEIIDIIDAQNTCQDYFQGLLDGMVVSTIKPALKEQKEQKEEELTKRMYAALKEYEENWGTLH